MTDTIKVAISGIGGRMGRASLGFVSGESDMQVVGALERKESPDVGKDTSELSPVPEAKKTGILVAGDFAECVSRAKPDVILDFTRAEVAAQYAMLALEQGIRPVIGTSGLSAEAVSEIDALAKRKGVGAMIVPNFSVGAVLMMEFAKQGGPFYENVEIIEMHHTGKIDAPSGTAMHTADNIAASGGKFNQIRKTEHETLAGARGGQHDSGVRVHSLRLPGVISNQEVLFAAEGEHLVIKHTSFNTTCFRKGILLAIRSVMKMNNLEVGLERLLKR